MFTLDYWGLSLKQASDGLPRKLVARQEVPPLGASGKLRCGGPQRPAQVALGSDLPSAGISSAADFAMTLGEFYCKA